ncbi:amidohydrolase family protein [Streptomyces sp. NBC_01314]|uniref:amidohydrolase family protein n=1 Tax=Streptomyces sp. NBC_01314 TaxID=2903821 RepID=UPI00352F3161
MLRAGGRRLLEGALTHGARVLAHRGQGGVGVRRRVQPSVDVLPRLVVGLALPGSACANHLDALTSGITVGRAADLVVLDRDPFSGPPGDIAATRVLETFVDGVRVHAAPDA